MDEPNVTPYLGGRTDSSDLVEAVVIERSLSSITVGELLFLEWARSRHVPTGGLVTALR